MDKVDNYYDLLIDSGIVSKEAVDLVTTINGYSIDTLNDILFALTGERDIEEYFSDCE